MSIASVEQHIIDTAKAAFGGRLKAVESLPADWDEDTFRRILRLAPGLFVVFGGGPRDDSVDDGLVINAKWGLMAVTTHASGELAQRRGDTREIGAYEIIETCAALFHQHAVPGEDRMLCTDVQNLFSGAVEKQGASLYGAEFSLRMSLASTDAGSPLDDFKTFTDKFDLAVPDGQAEAEDHVELAQ